MIWRGKIHHAHGFEELILLKWLYYPMTISVALQIQCNPYQNASIIFHRTRTHNSKNCVETLKTQTAEHNLEKEEQSWRYRALWLQTIAQSYSHQNSMVLTWKQTQRSTEQNRVQKWTQLWWLVNRQQRRQEHTTRKTVSSINGAGKTLQFSSVALLCPTLWDPHGLQHTRPPCPSPTPGACSNPCPSSWWCYPTISSSIIPFSSCPQSFPASGSFQMSQLFTSGGQSIGVSASTSALPMNIQGWLPLG